MFSKIQKRNYRKPLATIPTQEHVWEYKQALAGELDAQYELSDDEDYAFDPIEAEKRGVKVQYEEENSLELSDEEGITLNSDSFDEEVDIDFIPYLYPHGPVELSEEYRQTFEKLMTLDASIFLCGGAVIDLIENTKESKDLDFVIPAVNTEQLESLGYLKNHYRKNSYFTKEPLSIDIAIDSNITADSKLWMVRNVANRDFTVCQLYCNAQGEIYDPTNRGLEDLKARVLSMGGGEKEKLEACPARVIRAIKYMQRGFMPDDSLDWALKHFYYLEPQKSAHLYAVTRKVLNAYDDKAKQEFFNILQNYGLAQTLFNLKGYYTVDDLLAKVNPQTSAFSFFSPTKEQIDELLQNKSLVEWH